MKVAEVLVHHYKSIYSEVKECRLRLDENITFLIGANESGKTNILEAMMKFFQGGFEKTDIPYMCPWRGKPEIPDDLKMVSVTFAIDDSDRQQVLTRIHPALSEAKEVTITRNYGGEPYISSPDIKAKSKLDELLSGLRQDFEDFVTKFRKYIKEYKRVNKASASSTRSVSARLSWLTSQIAVLTTSFNQSKIASTLKKIRRLRAATKNLANPLETIETDVLKPLEKIAKTVEELPKLLDAMSASQRLWKHVPQFAFVSANPELWLTGQYRVEDIIYKPEGEKKLVSVRRLLSLADLNLDSVRNLSDDMQTVSLESAAQKVTHVLRGVWKQEAHIQLKFEWSPTQGNKKLLIMVESAGHRGSPQDRSYGFRWFLEFYLLYAVALRGNRVLVFEEPGIHLHPDAQDDLKRVMRDKVAAQGQIVYTTHLPGMYDLAYPEGCRAAVKESGVSKIEARYSPQHQYTTWEVAMRALGIAAPILRMYSRNIITEGPSDWIYLLTLAQLLAPEESRLNEVASGLIHIFPCQGASTIPATIPFFFQPGVKSVILLDSDQAGQNARDKIERQFNPPTEHIVRIVMVNDVEDVESSLSSGEHELEDLFGIDYYASLVSGWLGQGKLNKKDIKKPNRIAYQAANIIKEKYGKELRKDEVAWYFRNLVQCGSTKVPDKAMARFKDLLLKVTEGL